ncbi:MAG: DUF2807 domain-containing protein [Pedobacter sp.]|nr:DUF2807 domain-containing protein [Pedobacter sp.]MDQ8053676.1 DUF2807 domain-containing protein [Pedobacter sp.]
MAFVLTSATVYANGPEAPKQIKASAVHISSIKKLVISGNVEVTISQQPKAKALFTNEGGADVSVKKVGNTLVIDSKGDSQGKVTVYVDDIYRIDASGNAVVQTEGALNLKYLQVFLAGNAAMDLNAKTESLYTVMKNTAALTLKGTTDFHIITMEKLARITLDRFTAKKTDMSASDVYVAARR